MIVVVAVGTRGDVQPLLEVALQLAADAPDTASVALVTHAALLDLFAAELSSASGVAPRALSAPPARVWEGATAPTTGGQSQAQHRREILAACADADTILFNLFALRRGTLPSTSAFAPSPSPPT